MRESLAGAACAVRPSSALRAPSPRRGRRGANGYPSAGPALPHKPTRVPRTAFRGLVRVAISRTGASTGAGGRPLCVALDAGWLREGGCQAPGVCDAVFRSGNTASASSRAPR
jgi:hypothetical protein